MATPCISIDDVARYVSTTSFATRDAIGAHVDSCSSCQDRVAAAIRAGRTKPAPADDGVLELGACVGRYIVIGWLGAGGMGRVYTAYDPELDRNIALKLLRSTSAVAGSAAFARLVREAQLTARLSHPNVVAVHDVGSVGDHVFIAMELVRGETLRDWLAPGRDWRSVVAMFRQVGEGLAAAHAAGLIHRDVKPDNVLVGADHRARVTDFGLARLVDDASETDGPPGDESAGARITRTGMLLGTPAYMSPEQLRGDAIDERSDQFSFCVALYEGLHGVRPFAGDTLDERRRAIEEGLLERPVRGGVPRWVHEHVVRGLAAEPAARHPSMTSLLAALGRDPRARRRRIALGAGLVLAASAGIVWARSTTAGTVEPCRASAGRIATAWNPYHRVALEAAFRATGRPFAELAIAQVSDALDGYADRWVATHEDACKATHVRGDQSAELLDRRNACLEEGRAALAQQVALFAKADGSLVDRSVRLANELVPLDACSNTKALLAVVPLPVDRERRERVEELRGRIAAASVLSHNAKFAEARSAAETLRPTVEAVAYAPLTASLDEVAGVIAEDSRDFKSAIAMFDRAIISAEAGADDMIKARALIGAGRVRAFANVDPELSATQLAQARATIARVGGDTDLELRLELAQGAIALLRGTFDVVPGHMEAALALAQRRQGPSGLQALILHTELAQAYERVGSYDDAAKHVRTALHGLEATLGAHHPRVAMARGVYGTILYDQAKYDEALAQQQRALADLQALFGENHQATWPAMIEIGRVYEAKQKFADALAIYERARDVVDAAFGREHPNAVLSRLNLASALLELGRMDEAVAMFREVIALADTVVGPDSIYAANAQNGIAQAWRHLHPKEALVAAEEALRLFRALAGDAHADVGRAHDTIGKILVALDRRGEAIQAFERAIAIRGAALGEEHPDVAESRFSLALELYRRGDRARARTLAAAARDVFARTGDPVNAATITSWLAEHP